MRFVNTWGNSNKQADKFQLKVRFGKITVFDFYCDCGDHKWALTFMNFTIKP